MKKSFIILLIAALCLVLSCGVVVAAANAGSADDPLVTKSYVDSLISEIKEIKSSSVSTASAAEYVVLEKLPVGTIVVGGNSTEMILRTGNASVYIPAEAGGGLSDLTAGANLSDGKAVSKDHLILFPRDDGRALKVTRDNTYIMVKGDYTIQ